MLLESKANNSDREPVIETTMNYYLWISGEQCGPFVLSQVENLWKSGAVTCDTPYWHEGMPKGEPLQKLFESPQQVAPGSTRITKLQTGPEKPQFPVKPATHASALRVALSVIGGIIGAAIGWFVTMAIKQAWHEVTMMPCFFGFLGGFAAGDALAKTIEKRKKP